MTTPSAYRSFNKPRIATSAFALLILFVSHSGFALADYALHGANCSARLIFRWDGGPFFYASSPGEFTEMMEGLSRVTVEEIKGQLDRDWVGTGHGTYEETQPLACFLRSIPRAGVIWPVPGFETTTILLSRCDWGIVLTDYLGAQFRYDYSETCPIFARDAQASTFTIKLRPLDGAAESGTVIGSVAPGELLSGTAEVFDQNNQRISNASVRLEVDAMANSGGHQHHAGRPKGALGGGIAVMTGTTSAEGLPFTFTAPAVSGDHRIRATCMDRSCTQTGADRVWVGVKDLIPIQTTDAYVLLPNRDEFHPANHYMTFLSSLRLTVLAALYHGQFPDDPLLHLNDASLERGGLFDIGHNWSHLPYGHETHRLGNNIDIRANSLVGAVPSRNFSEFRNITRRVGGRADIHSAGTPNQHFHVTF